MECTLIQPEVVTMNGKGTEAVQSIRHSGQPIDVMIMNAKKVKGKMGVFRGNKAIRVEKILT